jgi:hypothetical protein
LQRPAWRAVLLLLCVPGLTLRLFGGEILVAHVDDVDPGVRHFVDGAIAPADPLVRIGIALLRRRVVVPRRDLQIVPFGSSGAASSA